MFKSILVTLDGSEPAANALGYAIDLARRYDSSLFIAHVQLRGTSIDTLIQIAEAYDFHDEVKEDLEQVQLIPTAGGPMIGIPMVIIPDDVIEKVGRLLLAKAVADARASGVEDTNGLLLEGAPANAILEAAKEKQAELIVVGSRGHGDLKSLVLGSISHKLLQDAECPCLVVK